MPNDAQPMSATDLAELKELFGPPPVLSTESAKAYDEILARLMRCFKPKDFMEQLLVWDLAVCTWEMGRYTRHKTLTMERKFRQLCELQAQRAKLQAEKEQQDARALARAAAERAGKTATELDRKYELEDVVDGAIDDIKEILDRPPVELDHARALESGIAYHEKLDDLLNKAASRRNHVLRLFEQYREGLGQCLRRVSDEIIDGQCKDAEPQHSQVEAALVPSAEPHDL